MPYYCVAIGMRTGIYSNWDDCKKQVHKFPKCKYKKFDDFENAKKFMELWCTDTDYHTDFKEQNNKIKKYFTH